MEHTSSGDSDDRNATIKKLLEDLGSSNISLNAKYRVRNQLKKLAVSTKESFRLVTAALQLETGYVYKRLLLDCELEALNIQYLFDLFKNADDPGLIKYGLSKYHCIFKQDTAFTDADTFVNTLLPVMPFNIRNQILRYISTKHENQSKCDKLYEALEKCLEPTVVNILLPACSAPFVADVLQRKKHIGLTRQQFKGLFRKHPKLAIQYIKENPDSLPARAIEIQKIIRIDPITFAELFEKRPHSHVLLSSSQTKMLMNTCYDRVLDKAKIYWKILHSKTLFRIVGKETYMKFVVESLSSTIVDFGSCEYNAVPWIRRLPKTVDKAELLKEAFKLRYGTSLSENPSCIVESLLELSSASDRDHYADLKMNHLEASASANASIFYDSVDKGRWLMFKPIEKSIPAIKALIGKEPEHFKRQQLLCYLIKACNLHHDAVALTEVCKYYVERHRNERPDTHAQFISDLSNCFDAENLVLDTNALHHFVEIVKLYMVNMDKNSYIQIPWALLERIYFAQVENNIPSDWVASLLFRIKIAALSVWSPNWTFSKTEHLNERYLFLMDTMVEKMDTLNLETEDDWAKFLLAISQWYRDWNRHVVKSKNCNGSLNLPSNLTLLNRFPKLGTKLLELVKNVEEIDSNLQVPVMLAFFQYCSAVSRDPSATSLITMYGECLTEISDNEALILYFLKRNMAMVNEKWSVISDCLFTCRWRMYCPIVSLLKQNGYVWHLAQVQNAAIKKLKDDSITGSEKMYVIGIASLTFSTEKFLAWIEDMLKSDEEPASGDEAYLDFMSIRRAVCLNLKNVEYPTQALPVLLQFCAGDYLKFVLGSLRSIVVNGRLVEVQKFLLELCQRPAVSVKKHGIRFLAEISLNDGVCKFLMELWVQDKHQTTRTVILTEMLQRLQYDESAWTSFQVVVVPSIAMDDKESMTLISKFSTLPDHLVEPYGSLLWSKYKDDPERKLFSQFVSGWMNTYFERLSAAWLLTYLDEEPMLDESAEDAEGRRLYSAAERNGDFLIRSLLKFPGDDDQKKFLAILDKNLKKVVEPFIQKLPRAKLLPSFKMFSRFIQSFCQMSFSTSQEPKLDTEKLLKLFRAIQHLDIFATEAAELVSLRFFLTISEAMHANKSEPVEVKGQLSGRLLDEAIGKYGVGIFPYWAKLFRTFIRYIWTNQDRDNHSEEYDFKLDLATGLLQSSGNYLDEKMILALTLMSPMQPGKEEVNAKYFATLNKIMGSESTLVRMHFVDWCLEG